MATSCAPPKVSARGFAKVPRQTRRICVKPGVERSSGPGRQRRLCLAWFVVFALLSGYCWPSGLGLAFMGLAYLGVLHLAMLVLEEVTSPQFHAGMSPEEFERYCASLLRERKWAARVTPASGDQGVDIVAEKRGLRIVVQCKKYSKPVGNRAVQEVVAGIAHQDAQRGVVVATSGYTASAIKLAASNEVLLLHHAELHRIDRLLR
jgi:restriction system protein